MKMRIALTVLLSVVVLSLIPIHVSAVSPVFAGTGTLASSTGADVTVSLPVGWEPDDIFLMIGVVRDVNDAVTVTGWTAHTGSPFDRSTVSRYWTFWKRAVVGETNPLFDKSTATGDTFVQIIAYRGAVAIGSPWEIVSAGTTGTSDPASCPSITTLTPTTLIVNPLAGEDDNNALVTTTGTNPINYVEHYAESAIGTDGMIAFSEKEKPSAGSTGTISVNFDITNPVGWGCMTMNLIGPPGGSGSSGHNSLITLTAESPGANCVYGGTKVESGVDDGDGGGTPDDGTLQAGEIDSTAYICNGAPGTNGTNGFHGLVNLTAESPGGNCATGGTKVDAGLDNGDGGGVARDLQLQSGEIDVTKYVCNGATGATGATGAMGPAGPQGSPGPVRPAWLLLIMSFIGSFVFIAWGFKED